MKVENFSDEKVREMAANVLMDKITITQSSFDAMKARCALFDELTFALRDVAMTLDTFDPMKTRILDLLVKSEEL